MIVLASPFDITRLESGLGFVHKVFRMGIKLQCVRSVTIQSRILAVWKSRISCGIKLQSHWETSLTERPLVCVC